jgi:hypothetical protein
MPNGMSDEKRRVKNTHRKPPQWLLCHLQTSINQSSAAPLVRASLSLSKFKKQVMMSKKSQIQKHIHKSSVMLCLHTLTTDQSESKFNVRYATRLLEKDLKRI